MCGRLVRSSPVAVIASEFRTVQARLIIEPSYNIAPSQNVLAIIKQGTKELVQFRWGFIPSWAKDQTTGNIMINARAETIASKPSFKFPFKKNRCLVVADGFYEWKRTEKVKVPFYIHLKSGKPFGIAGIYNKRISAAGETIFTCAIITTIANEILLPVHDRMPAIIPEYKVDSWLDTDIENEQELRAMLKPYPAEKMEMYEVSASVNNPSYDVKDAISRKK